jgi:hypothetical protein
MKPKLKNMNVNKYGIWNWDTSVHPKPEMTAEET